MLSPEHIFGSTILCRTKEHFNNLIMNELSDEVHVELDVFSMLMLNWVFGECYHSPTIEGCKLGNFKKINNVEEKRVRSDDIINSYSFRNTSVT